MEEFYGKDSFQYGRILFHRGTLESRLGNHTNALQKHREAYKIYSKIFGQNHGYVGQVLNSIGEDYYQLSDQGNSMKHFSEALKAKNEYFGADHPSTKITQMNIDRFY